MRYLLKYFSLAVILLFLSSCSLETLSPKASKQEQEQVKQKVLSMLEKEYNQPFKILDFNYDYKFHYKVSFLVVVGKRYGTYNFKIQAVDNPIIVMKLKLEDSFNKDDSALSFFIKRRLNNIYCSSFGNYWKVHKNDKDNKQLEKNIKYCDSRGQKSQYDNPLTR